MRTQPEYPRVVAAIEMFADWWEHRRHRSRDLATLGRSELEDLARDLGMSAADLHRLDESGSELQLPRMMTALHLDPNAVARTDPALFRDMQRLCAACGSKKQCARDLWRGTAATKHRAYCGNASSLEAIG